jgi:prolyl oligopeptidase
MMALSLHEGVPGHHLQIALAMEHQGIPNFRRYGGYTAFIEGWGLYAESLGDEMGLYDDTYSKFGQLMYNVWRASRLVVDTGMHYLHWDRQKAIDFMMANTAKQELEVAAEIDRYIVWPGQALAYKIGQLKITELRARAKQALGDKFDIREFHDELLKDGALPLDQLEAKMNEWLEKREIDR